MLDFIKRRIRALIILTINIFLCGTHLFELKRRLLNLCHGIRIEQGSKVVGPIYMGQCSEVLIGKNVWVGRNLKIYGDGQGGNRIELRPCPRCHVYYGVPRNRHFGQKGGQRSAIQNKSRRRLLAGRENNDSRQYKYRRGKYRCSRLGRDKRSRTQPSGCRRTSETSKKFRIALSVITRSKTWLRQYLPIINESQKIHWCCISEWFW